MKVQTDIKQRICGLFEVTETGDGGWCVVTPLQYSGSNDHVVIHIQATDAGWRLHDNGDAILNANLLGFDTDTDALARWVSELDEQGPVSYDAESELLCANTHHDNLLAPYLFRVAEAALGLFTTATQRSERRTSHFKTQLQEVVSSIALGLNVPMASEVELPIAGGLTADFVFEGTNPLIIVAATSTARLLEAEIIFMQYRHQKMPGFVLAIAENAQAVGRKQFDRANFYTGKTVGFDRAHLPELIKACLE